MEHAEPAECRDRPGEVLGGSAQAEDAADRSRVNEHSCTTSVVTGAATRWSGSLLASGDHSGPGAGGR